MKQVDIAIIGCGPAGLSAAVNVAVRNKTLLLAGPKLCSPALHKAHKINNYLGLYDLSGEEMRQRFLGHAVQFDIDVTQVNITGIFPVGENFQLQIKDDFIEAKAVIITTGVSAATLVAGEDQFVGKGVSYCGTCDAMFYKGKTLVVSSDAASHEDEVKFLAEVAGKIYFLPQYDGGYDLPSNVEVIKSQIKTFSGEERMQTVLLENGSALSADGAFLLKEQMPLTQLLPGLELAEKHIKTDDNMATSLPGVFAAGDVTGRPYQIAKAVGQGQMAALSAVAYVDAKK